MPQEWRLGVRAFEKTVRRPGRNPGAVTLGRFARRGAGRNAGMKKPRRIGRGF